LKFAINIHLKTIFSTITHNGWGLCEVGDLEAQMLGLAPNFD
jgi:hypothetical protein